MLQPARVVPEIRDAMKILERRFHGGRIGALSRWPDRACRPGSSSRHPVRPQQDVHGKSNERKTPVTSGAIQRKGISSSIPPDTNKRVPCQAPLHCPAPFRSALRPNPDRAGRCRLRLCAGRAGARPDRRADPRLPVQERVVDRDQFRFHGGTGSPAPVTFDRVTSLLPQRPGAGQRRPGDLPRRPIRTIRTLSRGCKTNSRSSAAKVLAGEIGATPRWSCKPGGVPGFSLFVVEPVYIVQGPKKVLLIYQGNQEVRHVYLNVPHSANPKPSWYGEFDRLVRGRLRWSSIRSAFRPRR